MKTSVLPSFRGFLLLLCVLLPRICPAPPIPVCPDCGQTYDNGPDGSLTGEFAANADFNGDGRVDFLVLDKATGAWRLALANAGDAGFTFSEVKSAGMTGISGMAVGNFLDANTPAIGVASAIANRVHLFGHGMPGGGPDDPENLTLPSAGPAVLGPLDVPGAVNNALEEVNLVCDLGVPANYPRRIMRRGAFGGWSASGSTTLTQQPLRLGRILATADTRALGAILADGTGCRFELWTAGTDALTTSASVTGLPANCRFTSGPLETAETDVVFYVRGSSTVRTSRISSLIWGLYTMSAPAAWSFSKPVQAVYTLSRGAETELLVLFTDQSAQIHGFTAAGGFTPRQSLPVAGLSVTGAVPLHDAGFIALSPAAGDSSGLSGIARRFQHDGSSYVQTWQGTLPAVKPTELAANVLFFDKHPLAYPDAALYSATRLRNWSRDASMDGSGNFTATSEAYVNPMTGLGNPLISTPTPPPPPEPDSPVVLTNQTGDDLSFFSYDATLGAIDERVTAEPPGGDYDTSVQVTLSARKGTTTLYWRTSPSAAFQNGTQPPPFVTDTTLEFYGRAANGVLTPRQTASYTFRRAPQDQDSDGDGVPDFVERELGLDPEGSLTENGTPSDYDGDGFGDLDELLAGGTADPANPAAKPAETARTDAGDTLALTIIPRGLRVDDAGGIISENAAAVGTAVQVHDTTGVLLGQGLVDTINSERRCDLVCTGIHDRQRVLIISTQPIFTLPASGTDPTPAGRETFGMVRVPAVVPTAFTFSYNATADAATEAQRWITARRAAGQPARPAQRVTIDHRSTARLLMLERFLHDLGAMHGVFFNGTLTPFRDLDMLTADQKGFSFAAMEALAAAPTFWSSTTDIRAWRIADLAAHIDSILVDTAADPLKAVLDVAKDIYRISATYNNSTPGRYRPPFDVLREFVSHGMLDAEYEAKTTVSQERRMSVLGGMYAITFAAPTRPVFQGTGTPHLPSVDETLHTTFRSGTDWNLVKPNGFQWLFPGSFGLTASTQVEITAFADMGSTAGRENLEVIAARVTSFDLGAPVDLDGNLLADAWERYFLGSTGFDPLSRAPGSGHSLLQEYLLGSDPDLTNDQPSYPPVDLIVSELEAIPGTGSEIDLRWKFPAGYGGYFRFGIQESADLGTFSESGREGSEATPGEFSLNIPRGTATRKFFRVVTRLR
jgi:hypothetical protein